MPLLLFRALRSGTWKITTTTLAVAALVLGLLSTSAQAQTANPPVAQPAGDAQAQPASRPVAQPAGESDKGLQISPLLVGNNAWYNPSPAVFQASAGAGLKLVRIGGNAYRDMPSTAQLETWVNEIKAIGAEPMIQVTGTDPVAAADLVRYFNVTTHNTVKYWNIGNEPWCNSGQPSDLDALAQTVARYVKANSSAMKDVDSNIQIFAPDECDWLDTMYADLLGGSADITGKDAHNHYYIDGVSFHRYPQWGNIDINLTTDAVNDLVDRFKKAKVAVDRVNAEKDRHGTDALQWGIGEFNQWNGALVCQWDNGQFFAQVYGAAMKYGATYAATWSMLESTDNPCGPTDYGFLNSDMTPRSTYLHMQMVSQNFSGRYADGTSSVPGAIRAYGSVDRGRTSVMLLNIGDTAQDCTVRLNTDATGASGCAVTIAADQKVTYNQAIGAHTSMVLVFGANGHLAKRVTYSNTSSAPVTETF